MRGRRPPGVRHRHDRGSAVVEFVLVAPLLMLIALAVIQVVLTCHVRATLTSAAAEGARAASLAGADPAVGVARTRMLLEDTLSGSVVTDVSAQRRDVNGLSVIAVRVTAHLPFPGLLGNTTLSIEGHALEEGWT